MSKYIVILVMVLSAVGVFFVANSSSQGNSAEKDQNILSMQTIQSDILSGSQLIDVRTPQEFASEHISGSLNLPLDNIKAGNFPQVDKTKKLYVYCRSGNRSAEAARILTQNGFNDVVDLGGINDVVALGGSKIN
jgi:rhodanese-related sulfurtransferase